MGGSTSAVLKDPHDHDGGDAVLTRPTASVCVHV